MQATTPLIVAAAVSLPAAGPDPSFPHDRSDGHLKGCPRTLIVMPRPRRAATAALELVRPLGQKAPSNEATPARSCRTLYAGMEAFNVAWDAWRTTRGGAPAIAARQARRLEALVAHARRSSRFYAEHYRDVPAGPIRLTDLATLPPAHKPALMAHFDDWVTDPRVTRARASDFVADTDNIGRDFLGQYVVFTTSGSTAEPALLVEDHRAVAVMFGLTYARSAGVLPFQLLVGGHEKLPTGGHESAH
jgi:hypothetical protein